MNKRGSVSVLVTLAIPVAFIGTVVAIDLGRVFLAQSRLQAAVDAAALTAARDINSPNRDANTRAVLTGNYNGGAPPHSGQTSNNWTNVDIKPSGDQVKVEAQVEVKSLLGQLTGLGNLPVFTHNITRSAVADRTTTGLELALVVDVTLSMVQASGTQTRIRAAHEAATTLLGIIYGDNPAKPNEKKKWLEHVYISVVPFNVTVNYGSANTHFLSSSSAPNYQQSWSGSTSWGGCALMRSSSLRDDRATASNAGLRHYFWPSTYDPTKRYVEKPTSTNPSYCRLSASYKDERTINNSGANTVCMGHNDWTAPAYVLTDKSKGKQNTLIAAFHSNDLVEAAGLDAWATAHGPNMMCPPDTHRVLPLTRDRTVVEGRIDALRALPFSYGTNVAAGLQAGWFTLSEKWRKGNGFAGWPSEEPAENTNDVRPRLPDLPLNYYAENMEKVMVVLTDGDNLWMSARDLQSGDRLVRPESVTTNGFTQGFYGSYGYLGHEFDGDINASSTSDGAGKIDAAAEDWCAKIKAPQGTNTKDKITLYTVAFGSSIGSRAENTLRNCASISTKDGKRLYYFAPTAEKLKEVFAEIGSQLSQLRLSR